MALFSLCFLSASAVLQRLEHPIKADASLSFMVIGDWGRKGAYNQSQVATQVIICYVHVSSHNTKDETCAACNISLAQEAQVHSICIFYFFSIG